jgi:lysozyme
VTLFIPDLSHHQAGIDLHALKMQGSAAVIARVGQGAGRRTNGQNYGTTRDREWVRHRDEARRVGLPLVAYWYVGNLITPDENARLAEAWVGDRTIPWMIDHEDASGNGAMYCATVDAFRRRGLRVILGYVPNWYWAGAMNRSDLRCGPPIVNSRYASAGGTPSQIYAAAGGDRGNGWIDFGGQRTLLWQFTNKASMAGMAIDCSAFRGSLTELLAMINGEPTRKKRDKMIILAKDANSPDIWVGDGITRRKITDTDELGGLQYWIQKTQSGDQEVQQGWQDLRVLGTDVTTALGALADDETKIVDAVREIVAADSNADIEISPEQVQRLADAVVAAVPPHVATAVREAFARAGAPEVQ